MLPPSVVDGRSRNPLYYYYYYSDILEKKISNQSDILAVILSDRFSTVGESVDFIFSLQSLLLVMDSGCPLKKGPLS